MIGRIVEIAQDSRHLAKDRGFMVVSDRTSEVGRVPLADIAAVIGNAHGLSYSNNLLVALAEQSSPFVLCGSNHLPVGVLWSLSSNYEQGRRIDAQLAASQPRKKQLWASIVRAKLQQQAAALEVVGVNPTPLLALVREVKSGDPSNVEAQGARRYWTALFGPQFRRDREAPGTNAMLNYGYTVLRAATARAVLAAGLHPTIGLNHSNAGNSMRLVDDLMEPFRPIVDLRVWGLTQSGTAEVSRDVKVVLASTLYTDIKARAGVTPLASAIQRVATSLAQCLMGELRSLEFPAPLREVPLAPTGVTDH
jgi:CRISPR-associated protein Cas1